MRIANQSNLLTIPIIGGKDFSLLHRIEWKNDLSALPGESGGFQMYGGGVTLVSEVKQKFSLNSRIGQSADFGELIGGIGIGQVQLLLDKLKRLLRKKLGRQVFAHLIPVALFF